MKSLLNISDNEVVRKHAGIGKFSMRYMNIDKDAATIHRWVNHEYAKYWMMQNSTLEQVRHDYSKIQEHSAVFIGSFNYSPSFLMECYKASDDLIGKYYDAKAGDYGMHILVAPVEVPIKNFTWHIFTMVMDFIFSHHQVNRIIVEPDINNQKIHALNLRAGFQYQKIIRLPHKTAHLAFCTREQYKKALQTQHSYNQ